MNKKVNRSIVERIMEDILTPSELADALSVSRGTVYNWIETGKLPSFKTGYGTVLIWRVDLEGAINKRALKVRTLSNIACSELCKTVTA